MPEIKELQEKIESTWEQMKAKNEEVLAEAKKIGEGRAEDKETLEKMSNAIDEQKKQLDDIAIKVERGNILKPGETSDS